MDYNLIGFDLGLWAKALEAQIVNDPNFGPTRTIAYGPCKALQG